MHLQRYRFVQEGLDFDAVVAIVDMMKLMYGLAPGGVQLPC